MESPLCFLKEGFRKKQMKYVLEKIVFWKDLSYDRQRIELPPIKITL